MNENADAQFGIKGNLVMNSPLGELLPAPFLTYKVECFDKDGNLKWVDEFRNLVTTAGKTDIVDKYFKGSSYTAAWYMGLKGAGTAAVGDTLASHAGWTEITGYTGNRQAITWGTTSSGSNTGTAVSFSITGSATVAGAFVTTASTGTSGTLYSVGDLSSSRSVINGDTLNVTPTVSVS